MRKIAGNREDGIGRGMGFESETRGEASWKDNRSDWKWHARHNDPKNACTDVLHRRQVATNHFNRQFYRREKINLWEDIPIQNEDDEIMASFIVKPPPGTYAVPKFNKEVLEQSEDENSEDENSETLEAEALSDSDTDLLSDMNEQRTLQEILDDLDNDPDYGEFFSQIEE